MKKEYSWRKYAKEYLVLYKNAVLKSRDMSCLYKNIKSVSTVYFMSKFRKIFKY
jgi:hypothetical protein